jgi:hypothetical protein
MKIYRRSGGICPLILSLGSRQEWSASSKVCFTTGKKKALEPDWVVRRRYKFYDSCQKSNPDSSDI